MRAFAVTVFVGALLLFLVEPFIGKALLPWFGGSPTVWTTCLVFFQLTMLGGYTYAHLLVDHCSPVTQRRVHLALVGVALLALVAQAVTWGAPLVPGLALKPTDSDAPVPRLLALLVMTVGAPFFLLSTTGPLMQAWFARVQPGAPAYRLYALSNSGSFLGLLGYPFFLEPALTLRELGWAWALVFGLFVLGVVVTANRAARAAPLPHEEASPTGWKAFTQWALLAAVPSVMLLAVTNHLSQEVAVSPLLWVAPLGLYLASFVLCFESGRWYTRARFLPVLALVLPVGLVVSWRSASTPLWAQLVALLGALFVVSMFCHGELAARRPGVRQLTAFYLAVSLGGAAGSLAVAVLAPLVFTGYHEFDVSFGLAWLAALLVLATDPKSAFFGARARFAKTGAAVWLLVLVGLVSLHVSSEQALAVVRNFYGVLKVKRVCEDGVCVVMEVNGRTNHGLQFEGETRAQQPTTYYGVNAGVGRAFANQPLRRAGQPMRVGVVGLGAGTLASFSRAGDVLRFYELNPAAIDLARTHFTFLSASAATIEVVAGDARLSLERELTQGSQKYDLLVVDAFSGDSIPAHLLTTEAFALYRAHLAGPTSLLAVHVSNRTVDLPPLVWSLADATGLACRHVSTPADDERFETAADWMLLSQTPAVLDAPGIVGDWKDIEARGREVRAWTDDFSNVLALLK
jgi:hypothetical protein